ncbi:MAG: NusG domain II-containing protein [Peptoniphilaceae bacterium]|nr:NusG domain II-containing protein [Peptoniphilaceae bacterium]MDY5765865.1 NusG domain II-containing protein [Peptoniphilaceae bacterium]
MHLKKMTNRADRILILILLVMSILGLLLPILLGRRDKNTDCIVSIQINGKEVQRFALNAKAEGLEKTFRTEYGTNIVKVEEQQVFIEEANCPDQLCVKQGRISRPGEMLICLPNRFLVEILADGKDSDEAPADAILH